MAKPEWSWSEKAVQKALEDFRSYLQSDKGKEHIKQHDDRQQRAQKFLKDETTIDGLTSEQLAELLRNTDAYYGDRRREAVRRIERGDDGYIKEVKDWLKRLIAYDGQSPLPTTEYLSTGYASELLTMRFPERFYLVNNASIEEIERLGQGSLPERSPAAYPQWRPLFEGLLERIDEVVQKEIKRPANFYDVDMFLWYVTTTATRVTDGGVWRIAPGEGGEWWEECKKNGCIVIGWDEAAKQAPNMNFRNLSRRRLRKLFQQVYRRRRGVGGWSQVWDFVHEVQPGDIIVAKRGTREIVGIGIVTSDCIPPGHPDHPLGDEHEFRHARKVDWRVTESIEVNLNLGRQTVARENRWDDIVKAYQERGIDVYKRLWSDQQPRIDLHEHLREDQQLPNGVPSLIRYFEAKGFQFDEKQVAAFYAALKTKGFVILSGLSGTGKTKLAQLFAELLCPCEKCQKEEEHNVAECGKCTHLFLSVRPDWRDSKALLGYYNPLTERYESTPLLEFLLRAARDYAKYAENGGNAQTYFVILDEMNLAHVEYYFADFLSVLESGRYTKSKQEKDKSGQGEDKTGEDASEQEKDKIGWTKESLRLERIGNLHLPPNLYIVGTVNIDETTYMFSPKVLDRAFTLEFREVDFSNYPTEVNKDEARKIAEQIRKPILDDLRNNGKFCAVVADKNEVREALEDLGNKKAELEELNRILQPYDLHFGYRVLDEIALFVRNAKNAPDVVGKLSDDEALDYAVLMKVLPKFHGPRQKLEKPLREVLKWAAKDNATDWVKDTSKTIGLEEVTEALRKWEQSEALRQARQEAGQGADEQDRQPVNAQQRQDNQTETTPDQATQGKAKDQSGTSTTQPFKAYFRYPNIAKKVLQMLRQLYETGFASFAQ